MKYLFVLRKKSGVTMFFVLMFMVIASLLGSSLMYLSSHQSEGTGDYYAKKTAEEAAESALDWFEGAVEDFSSVDTANITKIISWINDFDNSKIIGNRWYNIPTGFEATDLVSKDISANFKGSDELGASYLKLGDGIIKAKLKVESVDRINRVVVIKALGFGSGDSRKTIRAVYKLEGLGDYSYFEYDTTNNPAAVLGHAYYTDSRVLATGQVDFNISGNNVYLGGVGSNGSTVQARINIDGNLKVMGGMYLTGGSGGSVAGNLYVKEDFLTESVELLTIGSNSDASYCYIEGKFTSRSKGVTSLVDTYIGALAENKNGTVSFGRDLYIDDALYYEVLGPVVVGNDLYGDHTATEATKLLNSLDMTSGNTPIWSSEFPEASTIVRNEDGSDGTQPEEEVDIDVPELTSQASFSLGDIYSSAANYDTEKISLNADQVNDLYFTGSTIINGTSFPASGTIPGWSANEDEKFSSTNGVMVINFDKSYNNISNKFAHNKLTNQLDPGVKVALAVNDQFDFDGKKFWSAPDPTSALGIFCNPADNGYQVGSFEEFIAEDEIYGMFYSSAGGISSNQYTNKFNGAVILKGEDINYNSNNGDMVVNYDDNVVRAFAGISNSSGGSIFLDPRDGGSYEYQESKIDTIEHRLSNFKTPSIVPKLISKY